MLTQTAVRNATWKTASTGSVPATALRPQGGPLDILGCADVLPSQSEDSICPATCSALSPETSTPSRLKRVAHADPHGKPRHDRGPVVAADRIAQPGRLEPAQRLIPAPERRLYTPDVPRPGGR